MKELLVTFALLRGADLATTQAVLRQGGVERNPFLPQQPTANLVIGSLSMTAEVAALHRLSKSHPKVATWITIGGIVLEGWTVQHNAKGIR